MSFFTAEKTYLPQPDFCRTQLKGCRHFSNLVPTKIEIYIYIYIEIDGKKLQWFQV